MNESIFLLMATYFAHSTVFLAAAWSLERTGLARTTAVRELLWRCALLAGVATAALSLAWPSIEQATREVPARVTTAPRAPGASAISPESSLPARIPVVRGHRAPSSESSPGIATVRLLPRRTDWALPAVTRHFAYGITILWLLASIGGIAALLAALYRRASTLRRLPVCTDRPALTLLAHISKSNALRVPRLVEDPDSSSPTANLGSVLTLPPWALRGIGTRGLEAMLAHELGHIARRDVAWQLLTALVRAIFWFQPLNALAARRLAALAELGADDWAARATGNPRALAECLARCAGEIGRARAPKYAIAMTGGSRLLVRIQHLLQEKPMKSTRLRPVHRGLIAIALLIAVIVLPAIVIAPVIAGQGSSINLSSSLFGGEHTRVRINDNGLALSAEIRGAITFNDAENDVISLGEGDEAYIEQVIKGVRRRIEFEQANGKLVRRYAVDGRASSLDAEGRTWLATVVPTLLREAGIDAEGRVRRMLARDGAGAVLDEIALIHGNHVRKVYLSTLAGLGPLQHGQLTRAIALAGDIDSDFERSESFVALVGHQSLAAPQQAAMLDAIATMGSDFEARSVLEALAPKLAVDGADGAVAKAWASAVGTLGSSFERREALVALARRDVLPPAITQLALTAIAGIDSDFEQRTALEAFAPHVKGKPDLTFAYVKAVGGIDSDFERREALLAVLVGARIDAHTARAALDAVADMESDFEKGEVLKRIAARMPEDAGLIERYRAVARGMSDHERGQAEKALDRFAG